MKLHITGHGDHGKDFAARILSEETGLTYKGSSVHVGERKIWPLLQQREPGRYANFVDCFNDRRNRRPEWNRWIKEYCRNNLERLQREIFAEADIYVGIRDAEELAAGLCRAFAENGGQMATGSNRSHWGFS